MATTHNRKGTLPAVTGNVASDIIDADNFLNAAQLTITAINAGAGAATIALQHSINGETANTIVAGVITASGAIQRFVIANPVGQYNLLMSANTGSVTAPFAFSGFYQGA